MQYAPPAEGTRYPRPAQSFQHPCITPAASQRKILFKSAKKVIPVTVVKKDILAIQTPGDDMMNRPGILSRLYRGMLLCHDGNLPNQR